MSKNDDDDLIWQIGNSEPTRSTATVEQHVKARISLNLTAILIGCAGIVVALIAFWVFRWWSAQNAQAELRAVIVAEEQAARERNPSALAALSAADDAAWVDWQRALAEVGLSAPLPDPGLRASAETPEIVFVSLDGQRAHIRATRAYVASDGATFRYGADQFYQRSDGAWRRVPPSTTYWGTRETFWGSRIGIDYPAADADLIAKEVGPYIESILVRLCSTQPCPPERFPIRITLEQGYPADSVDASGLTPGRFLSPHFAGAPADARTLDWYRNGLARWVYAGFADQMYVDANGAPDPARIELIGVCLGIVPGERDLKACLEAGLR